MVTGHVSSLGGGVIKVLQDQLRSVGSHPDMFCYRPCSVIGGLGRKIDTIIKENGGLGRKIDTIIKENGGRGKKNDPKYIKYTSAI